MADKTKHKIVKQGDSYRLLESTDNWATSKDLGEPTPQEIDEYEYFQSEKLAGYKESEASGAKGLARLNELRANVGLPPAKNVKTGIAELQEYSGKNYDELVTDYMINRSPKPNKRLQNKLRNLIDPSTGLPYQATKAGAMKAYADKVLTKDEVVDAYKDNMWWFRAVAPKKEKVSKEKYEELIKRPGSVKQGESLFYVEDPNKPYEYTEYIPEDAVPEKEEEDQDVTLPPEKEDTKAGPIKENPIIPQLRGKEKAPWWLQDIIQTAGAAGDLARIKRYPPWQSNPQFRLPDATFYDPTRELAANTEQANLAYQTQAAFTNPQQLAAASSVTQGQAAKNAADIMGRYNNLNVGLANQLSKDRTDIMNVASQNKSNLDTQLWDKYTIMNQQFDNSKNQARQNLRNSYISAISNRANTANLNSLYPQYAVNTSDGGFAYFKGDPTKIKATSKYDYMDSLWEKAKQYSPNDPETMMNILLKGKGTAGESEDDGTTDPYQKWNASA